jgi:catalase
MATRKSAPAPKSAKRSVPTPALAAEMIGTVLSTASGPSSAKLDDAAADSLPTDAQKRLAHKQVGAQGMAQAVPFNALKSSEYGLDAGHAPQAGRISPPHDPEDLSSTITEDTVSDKVGQGVPPSGHNPGNGPLDRVRVDSGGQGLTTNQGVPIADNQSSLKAGVRGPTLLEDFILREKITHFDHERIPERVVHARGSAAHGYFECTEAVPGLTKAIPFQEVGKRTPVFTRFSTVAGERGSADLARDVRGFAVKFYTEQGNWDLVGNNIPVFFIQDGMKFPDLVHAVKPEPHHGMPQAASAHDTFWDFAGLMPEITHMLLWVMSDRAIPRSYRTMQGFGVHTFRLVNDAGESVFVKFHWNPAAGTHSLVWDEAVKVNGADPDYHRRDLWESIEAGNFPEWELQLQVFTEEQADGFSFDVLDPTKMVPEELVPLRTVGKMVLNRNPDNFFAETEQVAFCTQHVIPGIDFSNDPLLQARNFSYHDTQLLRLGGPNFHEIPINAPVAQVHNNQRDGLHRQAIPRGRVAYEPNSLGGGCPFQHGMKTGYVPFPAPVFEDKVRGKPEKFGDHFSQARLFWRSQTAVEKNHIIAAFRFELTKVQTEAVRERIVSMLRNVNDELAGAVAEGLGIALPEPQPTAIEVIPESDVETSPALSLFARPGTAGAKGRKVALLVVDGTDAPALRAVHAALSKAEAAPRFVGVRLGAVKAVGGEPLHAEITLETGPSVLWDAVVLPAGDAAVAALLKNGQALEFLKDQYRHCKPILVLDGSTALLEAAGISLMLPDGSADPGIFVSPPPDKTDPDLRTDVETVVSFIDGIAKHRHFERELDPPPV